MRQLLTSVFELAGFGCVTYGVFLLSTGLGFVVLGALLVAIGAVNA
jgi:hypothetical protein